ncbi:hypothetical protein EBZ39_01935, partial [bacterium]|nr:hypothetical protein [bacterium]
VSPFDKNDTFVGIDSKHGPVFADAQGKRYNAVNRGDFQSKVPYAFGAPVAADFLNPADPNAPPQTFTPAQAPAPQPQTEPPAQQPTQQPAQNPAAAANTTQNPVPQQPAGPQATQQTTPFESATAALGDAKTQGAEAHAAAEQKVLPDLTKHTQEIAAKNPEKVEAAKVVATQPGTPEAERALAPARSEFITQQAGGDQSKLQSPDFFGQAMGMWNGLGPMGQAAFMVGVPAALIGLLSGDGLSAILGGLGIGALGIGAGAMGMFGEGMQANMGRLLGDLGEATGFIPQGARDSNMFSPKAEATTREQISSILKTQGPEAAQKALDAERAKFDQLRQLHGTSPELAHTYLMGMRGDYAPKTREDAAALFNRLQQQHEASGRPDYLQNQAHQEVTNQVRGARNTAGNVVDALVPKSVQTMGQLGRGLAAQYLPQSVKNTIRGAVPQAVQDLVDPEAAVVQRYMQQLGFPVKKSSANIVDQLRTRYTLKQATLKAARCWAGYEPVPGAKAYSRGSCRPVGSKKTQKEMKSGKERHHETKQQSGAKG